LTSCYVAGLRVSEAIALTPPAIDSKRMVVRVEQGKGMKDRYVMLSPKLLKILRAWWRVERPDVALYLTMGVERMWGRRHKIGPTFRRREPREMDD
jgi:integrase